MICARSCVTCAFITFAVSISLSHSAICSAVLVSSCAHLSMSVLSISTVCRFIEIVFSYTATSPLILDVSSSAFARSMRISSILAVIARLSCRFISEFASIFASCAVISSYCDFASVILYSCSRSKSFEREIVFNQRPISRVRFCSEYVRNACAFSACFDNGPTRDSSSAKMSRSLTKLSSALLSSLSDSILRYLYFEMPAASSKISLRSSEREFTISSILPCPIIE